MAGCKKGKILIQYILLIPLFLAIFLIPVEERPADFNITSSTSYEKWGYYGDYCDQFWETEKTVLNNSTQQVRFYRSYCSI